MIITTTPAIEGKPVSVHLGIVAAEVIFGANIFKDFIAQGVDIIGGRTRVYEKVFADARAQALSNLESQAKVRGANAILNIRFAYQVLGVSNGMMMVAATGTAVVVPQSAEEQARSNIEDPAYYIEVAGRRVGPLSVVQIRELHAGGKIDESAVTSTEAGAAGPAVAELLA